MAYEFVIVVPIFSHLVQVQDGGELFLFSVKSVASVQYQSSSPSF